MKKRMLSFALSLAICLGLCVPALAVGQAGDTTIADMKGNIYTLSNPILYTIPVEELNCIQNDSFYLDLFKENVTTVYAISQNTTVSFPSGIGREGLVWVEVAEENGSFRVVDETAGGPVETSFGIDDSWGMTFILLHCYLMSGLKADTSNEGVGSIGMFEDGSFVDCLAFYVPADEKAGDPFAASSTIPDKPSTPTTPSKPKFTDVSASSYYSEPIAWAVEKGITAGTSDTTFSPDSTCTTAQILTFLWHSQGQPEPTIKNPFSDIKENDYFYKAALWASEKGLVSGSTFGGNAPCTRSATVTYLWKLAGSPAASHSNFTDVPQIEKYAQAVAWAVAQEITAGTSDTTFSPEATCTRGQIVTFLYRAYGK